MATPSKAIVLSVSLACALLATTFSAAPAAAKDVRFTLYGSQTGGWGSANNSLAWPGPHLTVDEGDNVTFNLTSVDGLVHNWYIDYDGDSNDDGNEPDSPDFTGTVEWNFTASQNGTYAYRSRFGADEPRMWGLITVRPAGSSPPPTDLTPGSNTLVIVGAALALVVAVIAIAVVMGRRRQPPAPPPPPE
jgi:FtsP/CotA-like multicopper oxidase with cupredoxin domain